MVLQGKLHIDCFLFEVEGDWIGLVLLKLRSIDKYVIGPGVCGQVNKWLNAKPM